jgi:hypothetical protein
MVFKQPFPRMLLAVLFGAALVGCGASPATGSYNGGHVTTDYNAPAQVAQVAVGMFPSAIAPVVTAATPTPIQNLADLTVAVTAKTHKSVLLKKFSCTVTVSNSSNVSRTGKVTVSFMHGAKPESGSPDQTQSVTVDANNSTTLTFTDTKWHLFSETANVTVVTDPYSAVATK